MLKVYKSRIHRIIINIVFCFFAAVLVLFIANIWFSEIISALLAVLFIIAYIWLVIINNFITITVDDEYLTVKKGRKEKKYIINDCSFRAKIVSSSGDSSCYLYVTEKNGKEEDIDCELIGRKNFENLMNDLRIIGDNAPVTKLKTEKGDS